MSRRRRKPDFISRRSKIGRPPAVSSSSAAARWDGILKCLGKCFLLVSLSPLIERQTLKTRKKRRLKHSSLFRNLFECFLKEVKIWSNLYFASLAFRQTSRIAQRLERLLGEFLMSFSRWTEAERKAPPTWKQKRQLGWLFLCRIFFIAEIKR